jgi:hypothetical protein
MLSLKKFKMVFVIYGILSCLWNLFTQVLQIDKKCPSFHNKALRLLIEQ